jgi:hypothetical protein
MSSTRHQGFIELFRRAPEMIEQVVEETALFPADGPYAWRFETSDEAKLALPAAVPDGILTRWPIGGDKPDMAIVLEVLVAPDEERRKTWPLFVRATAERYGCRVELALMATDDETSEWAQQPIIVFSDDEAVSYDPNREPDFGDALLAILRQHPQLVEGLLPENLRGRGQGTWRWVPPSEARSRLESLERRDDPRQDDEGQAER